MNSFNSIRHGRARSVSVLSALTFSLLGAACIGASEAATGDGDVLNTTVRYARGDLATDSGAQALYRRLTIAADRVCPRVPSSRLAAGTEARQCREHALEQAVLQINNSRLTGVLAAMRPDQGLRGEAHPKERNARRIRSVDSRG